MPRNRDFLGVVSWSAAGALLLPALLVATIWNGAGWSARPSLQDGLLLGSLILALAGWLSWRGPERLRARSSTAPMLVACGASLLSLAIVWNKAFFAAYFAGVRGHTFRKVFLAYRAPFYGRGQVPDEIFAGVAVVLVAGLLAALAWSRLPQASTARFAVVLGGFQLCLGLAITGAEDPVDLFGSTLAHATFVGYAAEFASPLEVLRGWVDAMPGFTGFARHYPPGLSWVSAVLGPGGAKLVFLGMPTLGLWAVHGITRELELEADVTRAALLAYATSASLMIFPAVTPTPSLLLPGALAAWLLLRALRTASWLDAALLGLVTAFFAFASFAVYLVLLPMGCLVVGALGARLCSVARVAMVLGVSLGVFVLVFVLLLAVAGFDLLACLVQANRITLVAFFPNAPAFALRVAGGFLAYAVSVGPLIVLAFGSMASLRRRAAAGWLPVFCFSMIAGFVLGGLSGRSYLETERIFMLYSPLLAVPAGWELARRVREEGRSALLASTAIALGLALVYGLFIQHHFAAR